MLGLLEPEINLLAGLCVCAKCIIKVVKHVYRKLATFLFSWIIFRVTNGKRTDKNRRFGLNGTCASYSLSFSMNFTHSRYFLRLLIKIHTRKYSNILLAGEPQHNKQIFIQY